MRNDEARGSFRVMAGALATLVWGILLFSALAGHLAFRTLITALPLLLAALALSVLAVTGRAPAWFMRRFGHRKGT